MPNLPAVEATKRAVHDTRTRVLLSKTKMTSIAEACGRNRMTVAKWLDGDPIETLTNALAAENTIPALAEGEVK